MNSAKPSSVARFELLMYVTLAIGVIASAIQWNTLVAQAAPVGGAAFVLSIQGSVFGFMLLMIWLVARRRKNWARWVLLILFLLGAPGYVRLFPRFMNTPVAAALSLTQVALQIVALVFIFSRNATDWFAKIPADPEAVRGSG